MAPSMHLHRQVCLFHNWLNICEECPCIWFLMRCGPHYCFELVDLKKITLSLFSVEPEFWILLLSLFLLGTCLGPSTFPSLWWLWSTPWPTSPTSLPWPLRSCCPPTLWQWWAALQLLQGQIFLNKRALYIPLKQEWCLFLRLSTFFCSEEKIEVHSMNWGREEMVMSLVSD